MTRRRLLLWIAIGIPLAILLFVATVAFLVLRTLESTPATSASATAAFEEVRRLFPPRAPLIEIGDLRTRDVRINRTPDAPRKKVEALHFMMWEPDDREIVRGSAPPWVTRLRFSLTGMGNWSFSDMHVTLEDIERFAPGIILDVKTPDGQLVLVWAR